MTCLNGMVEFWKILFNGQMVVLGNCDQSNAWLQRTPFVEGLGYHVVN